MPPVPLVRVLRSGVEESVHLGSVAVADARGRLVASAGDPRTVAFARSSMKPLQAAVSLSIAGDDLSDEELAVMCGSHNGERPHLEAVHRILGRAGLGPDALRCPPGWPLDQREARAAGAPAPILHNCSGKHAGMLLASSRREFDVAGYPDPGHPLQEAVLEAVRAASGREPDAVGVDGCGVPVHALPLAALATLYARLVRPQELPTLGDAVPRTVAAMLACPYLVAGRGRVCTAVMEAVPGVVVKVGAEGLMCAAIRDAGLGVAVKVVDGARRAQAPAIVRALDQLDAIDAQAAARLRPHAAPPVVGGTDPVGRLIADFELAAP